MMLVLGVGCTTAAPIIPCPEGTTALWTQVPTAGGELPPSDLMFCAKPDGVRHGAFAKWLNGRLWVVGHNHEGKPNGSFVAWHENGQKWMMVDFEDGEPVSSTQWNWDGIKVSEDTRGKHGEKGTIRHWYESGVPKLEAEQAGGEFHGNFRSWYESGQLRSIGRYAHNERIGNWACWNESGEQKLEVTHHPGGTLETDNPNLEITRWMQNCVKGCPGERLGELSGLDEKRRCSTAAGVEAD